MAEMVQASQALTQDPEMAAAIAMSLAPQTSNTADGDDGEDDPDAELNAAIALSLASASDPPTEQEGEGVSDAVENNNEQRASVEPPPCPSVLEQSISETALLLGSLLGKIAGCQMVGRPFLHACGSLEFGHTQQHVESAVPSSLAAQAKTGTVDVGEDTPQIYTMLDEGLLKGGMLDVDAISDLNGFFDEGGAGATMYSWVLHRGKMDKNKIVLKEGGAVLSTATQRVILALLHHTCLLDETKRLTKLVEVAQEFWKPGVGDDAMTMKQFFAKLPAPPKSLIEVWRAAFNVKKWAQLQKRTKGRTYDDLAAAMTATAAYLLKFVPSRLRTPDLSGAFSMRTTAGDGDDDEDVCFFSSSLYHCITGAASTIQLWYRASKGKTPATSSVAVAAVSNGHRGNIMRDWNLHTQAWNAYAIPATLVYCSQMTRRGQPAAFVSSIPGYRYLP
jgi:hypothetical protein